MIINFYLCLTPNLLFTKLVLRLVISKKNLRMHFIGMIFSHFASYKNKVLLVNYSKFTISSVAPTYTPFQRMLAYLDMLDLLQQLKIRTGYVNPFLSPIKIDFFFII